MPRVYGVTRLYTDLVALYEDVKVKEEALALAQKLLADTKAQVEEGTLARVEMTRANASVFSSRQDLINSRGLLEEQEAILKTVLTKTGNQDPEVRAARIIPTDSLSIPEKEEIRPIQDLLSEAMLRRPDLRQAGLQIDNSEIGLKGSRNAVRPEVDLVGVAQNNGLAGTLNPLVPGADPSLSAATAARWTRSSRASFRPMASACRSRCRFATGSPKRIWLETKYNSGNLRSGCGSCRIRRGWKWRTR